MASQGICDTPLDEAQALVHDAPMQNDTAQSTHLTLDEGRRKWNTTSSCRHSMAQAKRSQACTNSNSGGASAPCFVFHRVAKCLHALSHTCLAVVVMSSFEKRAAMPPMRLAACCRRSNRRRAHNERANEALPMEEPPSIPSPRMAPSCTRGRGTPAPRASPPHLSAHGHGELLFFVDPPKRRLCARAFAHPHA